MIALISENLGTIVVSLILILAVVLIIRSMINDKKQGKSSCGGNCAGCKMCASGRALDNK
ncbi:MAG: FeoB-associated Cys-rich membrane protein [Lachnospiraceae bacterium]|nr:FeoB-associated Cys-rich membrane protein [Lachnospiraceae bacterium]